VKDNFPKLQTNIESCVSIGIFSIMGCVDGHFLVIVLGVLMMPRSPKQLCQPKYPCRLCKGIHILKDCPGLSKVIEAWSTHPHQPMLLASEQHVDDLPSTSHDIVGKKKS
jgi:hypothetical protein